MSSGLVYQASGSTSTGQSSVASYGLAKSRRDVAQRRSKMSSPRTSAYGFTEMSDDTSDPSHQQDELRYRTEHGIGPLIPDPLRRLLVGRRCAGSGDVRHPGAGN